ncbi:hypothetical protein C8Q78DRAFT_1115205 [Trametes maxima]|nr:hypothetical protein C8Q78DRAFT_1115205 [Trametes maxima]
MSFLSRRRRAQAPLQDSANFAPGGPGSIHSVDKPPSVIRRHINLSSPLGKLTAKLSARSRTSKLAHAPIGNVGVPFSRWQSRSPSPAPSLDIRMPTGLGRRASELEERGEADEPAHARKRSVSLPAAAQAARWREAVAHDEAQASSSVVQKAAAISRVSPDLLSVVFSYVSRQDALSLAQVSKAFSQGALRTLYENLDLRDVDDGRAMQCMASLASRRHVASLDAPPPDDAMSLTTVTFAIAFNNMNELRSLTLPRFDLRLLCHTTFSLQRLALLCKNISADEFTALVTWLGRQPTLEALSFPRLLIHELPASVSPGSPPVLHTPPTPDTPTNDTDASAPTPPTSPSPIPLTVLPQLRRVHGPVAIAAALAPGRPLESAKLPIQYTLYDGLRPSAVMSALATARTTLKTLTIRPVSTKIDARTLERVVMSAGAELGDFIETLEVHWVMDDEGLYKLIVSVLGRFRALHTLRLLRDSPPPFPPSPLLEFPLPPASPPLSAGARTSISSFASAFPPRAPASGRTPMADTPFPRVHERAHLALWCKTCPSLKRVFFLSGAEWAVLPRSPVEAAFGLPPFEFVGYTQS